MTAHITHPEHQSAFDAGRDQMLKEIKGMGFAAARDKWNMENPVGTNPLSLGSYYYAKGGLQALVDNNFA